MSRDYNSEIADQENRAAELRDAMGSAREDWLELVAPWLADYWRGQARSIVVEQADHAQSVGPEGIRSIKTEVEALADRSRALLDQRLVEQGERLWPDLKPQTDPSDDDFRGSGGPGSSFKVFLWSEHARTLRQPQEDELKAPDQLQGPIRELEGEVLDIFRTHGFNTSGRSSGSYEPGTYFRRLERPWTRDMVDAINGYGDVHEQYVDVLRGLASLRREKSQSEASELWDSA